MSRDALVLVSLLSACGSIEGAVSDHRASVAPKIAAIEALAASLPASAATGPAQRLSPPPRFALSQDRNAVVLRQAELSPLALDVLPDRYSAPIGEWVPEFPGGLCTRVAAKLLRDQQLPQGSLWETEQVEQCLSSLERVRYALIVVEHRLQPPGASHESRTFFPGAYVADAHLYDLQTGARLGGFSFTASIRETSLVEGTAELQMSFTRAIEDALSQGLRATFPGAVFPTQG
ncbi:MAG: hypothetical protein K8H88_27470 [Sandaracinaceae bacterium]|nr:hypothetical protein [Sandaracinaceae bacterium]